MGSIIRGRCGPYADATSLKPTLYTSPMSDDADQAEPAPDGRRRTQMLFKVTSAEQKQIKAAASVSRLDVSKWIRLTLREKIESMGVKVE